MALESLTNSGRPDDLSPTATSDVGPAAAWPPQTTTFPCATPPRRSPTQRMARGAVWQSLAQFVARTTVLLVLLLGLRYFGPELIEELRYAWTRGQQRAEHDVAVAELAAAPLAGVSRAYQMVSQRVAPSVVHIETRKPDSKVRTFEGFGDLLRSPEQPLHDERNQGSGVIVTTEGHVVTNMHVVNGYQDVIVNTSDGRHLPAKVLGVDRLTDLAVLQVDAQDLIPAEWGDSDDLEEGALVWAIGSPFGFQHSITSGIVSAKNRGGQAGTPYQDFLQTDAAVNPGNSGGPLVDSQGRIVGINTMIVGPAFQGISLAIPSNVVRRVCDRLLADGQVQRGWLGIELGQLTPELGQRLGLKQSVGALVTQLVPQPGETSPAELAGLRPRDVIVEWDGAPVATTSQLSRVIAETPIGKTVSLVVVRDGVRLRQQVAIGLRPSRWN